MARLYTSGDILYSANDLRWTLPYRVFSLLPN